MIWDFRHEWPSGAQLNFNYYRHWVTLVVRDTEEGSSHLLHSKEGVTQGVILALITYDIGLPPLLRELWEAHTHVTHPWYAYDAVAGGGIQPHPDPPSGHVGDGPS